MKPSESASGLRDPGSFIPEMESLRGWAILLVVAFHYFGILHGEHQPTDISPFWLLIAAAGNTGVTLFFVLSGFLLTQPFIRALRNGQSVGIQLFYSARALRIIPLYYAFVCLAWVVTGKTTLTLKALLFQPVGFGIFPFSVTWWTLCTEVQFYLLLPWLMFLLQFRIGRVCLAGALLAWIAVHIYLFHTPSWMNNRGNLDLQTSLFGRGPAFLVGMLCAWFHGTAQYAKVLGKPQWTWIAQSLLFGGLYALLSWYAQTGQRSALHTLPMFHNIEAVFWGGILLCCMSLRNPGKLILINPIISHFGSLSYSIYLVHVPVQFYFIFWAQDNPEHWLAAMGTPAIIVVSFGLIWLLSLATYHGLEKPCLKLKSRIPTFSKNGVTPKPKKESITSTA